jgi:hypothetical protein
MPKNRAELVEKITKVWDEVITEDLIKKAARGLINRCQKVENIRIMNEYT